MAGVARGQAPVSPEAGRGRPREPQARPQAGLSWSAPRCGPAEPVHDREPQSGSGQRSATMRSRPSASRRRRAANRFVAAVASEASGASTSTAAYAAAGRCENATSPMRPSSAAGRRSVEDAQRRAGRVVLRICPGAIGCRRPRPARAAGRAPIELLAGHAAGAQQRAAARARARGSSTRPRHGTGRRRGSGRPRRRAARPRARPWSG